MSTFNLKQNIFLPMEGKQRMSKEFILEEEKSMLKRE